LRLIKERFVPVAFGITENKYQRGNGKFYPGDDDVWRQGGFLDPGAQLITMCSGANTIPGKSGWYFFTANGTPIKGTVGGPDTEALKKVLDLFAKLPEAERTPEAIRKNKPDLTRLRYRQGEELPSEGIALRVYTGRILVRDGKAEGGLRPARYSNYAAVTGLSGDHAWEWDTATHKRFVEKWKGHPRLEEVRKGYAPDLDDRDNLWITEAEWRGLVPSDPKSGDNSALAPSLSQRICHAFVVPDGSFWKAGQIKSADFAATVDEISATMITLRVGGSYHLAGDFPETSLGHCDYQGRLSGVLTYDRVRKAFTRFDLAAVGDWKGMRHGGDLTGAVIGFAFELADGSRGGDGTVPARLTVVGRDRYFGVDK
jgi:hypothetical protein